MTITSIQDFKDDKKYKKIIDELVNVILILNITQQRLTHYKHYIKVMEVISVIETNKTLLDFQKRKYEKELSKLKT